MARTLQVDVCSLRRWGAAGLAAALVLGVAPGAVHAQKLDIRNQSKILLGRSRITDTATLSDERYSFGFTNVFSEGASLSNAAAARVTLLSSTKLQFNAQRRDDDFDWELKLNQKLRSFTFDIGAGSNGLFHTGVLFGQRKGKGFGFSAAWVGDDRRAGPNLQLWHTVETIDVTFTMRHDRRGLGWTADTGKNLANILRGVLRYETRTGDDGHGSSQQVIYGRNMRSGADTLTDFDHTRLVPIEDVFSEEGVNIRSPLYPEDEPLAWLIEGYGARFGYVDLNAKGLLEAEVVSYISNSVWLGGELVVKDGVTDSIDTRFGITGEDLDLSATFGYSPHDERFNGAVQFRWIPFKPATPNP